MEFETKAGKQLHDSINHKKEPKKKKKTKEVHLTISGREGYLSSDGKQVKAYYPDGKSKIITDYARKMRTDFPEIKLGDKLSPKEARNLFKHNVYIQKDIKGAKLEVTRLIENKNGIRRYMLENKTLTISWAEGICFKDSKKSKLRDRHFILPVTVHRK